MTVPIFFIFQGVTGVPGFPGNRGLPVSKLLLLLNIFRHITHNNNTLEGTNSAPICLSPVQLNILNYFYTISQEKFPVYL